MTQLCIMTIHAEHIAYRAVLTLDSVTSHLTHFCAILPNAAYGGQLALYDLDPSDYPEDWHTQQDRIKDLPPYQGPWGATVTLPRCLPAQCVDPKQI